MAAYDIVAAVIGVGFIGPLHVEALRRIGVHVSGVAGATEEEAVRAASTLGLQRAYRSVEELLADRSVDAVHVASPNRLHASHVLAALEAGKHVICEKPLAMSVDEARTLVQASAARPAQIAAVNYNLRFYPQVLQARALCRAGDIGRTFHLSGSYAQDWLLEPTDFNWRVLRSEGGALRAVGDIGTHWMDMVTFITGDRIVAVSSDLRTVHPTRVAPIADPNRTFGGAASSSGQQSIAIDTEDYAGILLRFASGLRGVLAVSQVTAGRKNALKWELAGSSKAMAWDSETPNQLWIGERHEANRLLLKDPSLLRPEAAKFASYPGGHTEGFADTFKQAFRAIYDDIRTGASSAPLHATFADGLEEMCVCDAIVRSHEEGRWVDVPAQNAAGVDAAAPAATAG